MKLVFAFILVLVAVVVFPYFLAIPSIALLVIAYRLVRDKPEITQNSKNLVCYKINKKETHLPRDSRDTLTVHSNEELWAKALSEFEGSSKRPGLWAIALAESNGNEAAAKAGYLRKRVIEMQDAPPALISELRDKGYIVEFENGRWKVFDTKGGVTRYFDSFPALETQSPILLSR